MPSKKKARGRARREEKKNAAEAKCAVTKPCNSRNEMFDHFILPANCTEADIIECLNLYSELMLKVNIAETTWETKFRALNEIYPKYRGYSDRMKTVFRGLLLYDGTEAILKQASREDLSESPTIEFALCPCFALLYIEIRDGNSNPGAGDSTYSTYHRNIEINKTLQDLVSCPREIVKFFHRSVVSCLYGKCVKFFRVLIFHLLSFRRIPCDCLKSPYYTLKDSTSRTIPCTNCHEVKKIEEILDCDSNIAHYCCRDCQVKDWACHKNEHKEVMEARAEDDLLNNFMRDLNL